MGTTDSVVTVASFTCFLFDDSDKQANKRRLLQSKGEGKSKTGEREKTTTEKEGNGKEQSRVGGEECNKQVDVEETIAQEHDFQKLTNVQSIQHHQRADEIKAGAQQAFKEAA